MLQLYYTAASPPARAILQVIRILGLDVEVKHMDLVDKREHLTPEYLKLNPMHQVPALVDGDFVVVESRAIMAYLVNAYNPGHELYPTDPQKRALIDQRLYFDAINFFELGAGILRASFFLNQPAEADKIAKLKTTLELLESFLETDLYFAGDQPTLADVSILASFILFRKTFDDFGELPKLSEWCERCQSLPGFEESLAGAETFEELMIAKGLTRTSFK